MSKKKPQPEPDTRDPMTIYLEGSRWKTRCSELLEALRKIAKLPPGTRPLIIKEIANRAIRKFETF